mmetsp:Transcript_11914/g.18415  ORF Transcript_11914/g.18415 Transcript_11914/m.18415 type:complete len:235 (+) Transcript_11914:272-976(+)|eukprot:CAMPEP_0195284230 /NCGR_PEP_ID=MMETSP0707-20130614/2505_1 /TAXON_ID=33640 /ORGANISM="Asterionellopsis glacialis, Strain CCMP134" /LENGTH=234 /DNA_ID=CAMNT_0040343547 /DNA_START=142 /DNA_END=846 /DNA_ORIENTATION=-
MAPTLRFQIGSTVTPGDRIGSIREVSAGKGTYVRGGHVYASAVGTLTLQPSQNNGDNDDDKQKQVINVELRQGRHYASSKVLTVGTLIVGRVSRVMMQQAIIDMVAAEGIGSLVVPSSGGAGQPQQQPEGVIRKEDVRSQKSTEETLSMENCFRPGDIVLCRILALGDTRKFLCTTGETELGVLQALSSVSGAPMNPISWNEMQCPLSLAKESRKCAKPSSATASSTILMSATT